MSPRFPLPSLVLAPPLVALFAALAPLGCREDAGTTGTTTLGAGGAGGSVTPAALTIADWNVHNLVNDVIDSPTATQEAVVTTAAWTAHRAAVGKVLKTLNADVVMLAEVENQTVLDSLNHVELGDRYVHRFVSTGNDPRGINIAVLSKLPFDDVVTHADDAFTKLGTQGPIYHYARDCVEVHLTFNGRKIVLLGVHYKAKNPPDDPDKRLAEAEHTRALADDLEGADPSLGILILGDFNDVPGSPAYDWTVGDAPHLYLNADDHVAPANRWSFLFNGTRELIDQQMGNPVLGPMVDPGSVSILHGADTDAASDHAPVLATYLVH